MYIIFQYKARMDVNGYCIHISPCTRAGPGMVEAGWRVLEAVTRCGWMLGAGMGPGQVDVGSRTMMKQGPDQHLC